MAHTTDLEYNTSFDVVSSLQVSKNVKPTWYTYIWTGFFLSSMCFDCLWTSSTEEVLMETCLNIFQRN